MSDSLDITNHYSIGQYYSKQSGNCGYCSGTNDSYSYGLYTYSLRVKDYQDMIDRGWRRCGKYCYKSIMDKSCCPLYTIRCAAQDFKLSRTQKKILKKFNNFLIHGTVTKNKIHKNTEIMQSVDTHFISDESRELEHINVLPSCMDVSFHSAVDTQNNIPAETEINQSIKPVPSSITNTKEPTVKNKCMKAKQMRIQRKKQKLQNLGLSEEQIRKKLVEKKKYPIVKTIEDFLKESESKSAAHKLKISLVRSCPRSECFNRTFAVSFDLYKRYQKFIHKDSPEKLVQSQFERFLVNSSLQAENEYGSYHQQYWLDDKLIAVGVIDILPKCVSSVYFFYDPDYAHLSLGTYGALREVDFTRKLSSRFPDLIYYYMGFYIHSCVKMKYKGAFRPSFLLCPEVYTWHSIEKCLPKIEASKYSRLNEDPKARDTNSDVDPREVLIMYNHTIMSLSYFMKHRKSDAGEIEMTMECARLIGKACAKSMCLIQT